MATKTWLAAMKEHFGVKGESTTDFARQIKTLDPKDREDYFRILTDAGVVCEPPKPPEPKI